MKQIQTIALAFILAPFLFCGCATTGRPLTVKDFAPAVKTAAMVGTTVALQEHPEWRDGFTEALADLTIIEHSETIDFNTILKIVQRLPVKELHSKNAQLAITGGSILISEYSSRLDLSKVENIRPIAVALRQGVELGLQ